MSSTKVNKIFLFVTAVFVGVFLVNLTLILRASDFFIPFQRVLQILLKYSGIIVIVGYIVYFVMFVWLVDLYRLAARLKYLLRVVVASGIGVIIIWIFFVFLEKTNYPNYVFSTYSVYLPSLQIFANFQLILLISGYFAFLYFKERKRNIFYSYLIPMLIITLFVNTFLGNVTKIADILTNEAKFASQYYHSGGQIEKSPDFISLKRWSNFISNHTEDNSTIIHPKQSDEFPVSGNQPLMRYFMYPRTLVSETFADEYLSRHNDDNVYYLFKKANTKPEKYFPSKEIDFMRAYILFSGGDVKEYAKFELTKELDKIYEKIDIGVLKIR